MHREDAVSSSVGLCSNPSVMSVHYFIDGYNLIRAARRFGDGSMVSQRAAFLKFLTEERPAGSSRNPVTVVFDGRPFPREVIAKSFVEIVYSMDEDADTVIKRRVDAMKTPADAVVVTNDRGIQRWVLGAKARVMSCGDFLALGVVTPPRGQRAKLDAAQTEIINDELSKIWKLK